MARIEDRFACEAPKGDPLEREFIQSWDQVQQFYRSHYNSQLQRIALLFIAVLRKAGYDRKLRAGINVLLDSIAFPTRGTLRKAILCSV